MMPFGADFAVHNLKLTLTQLPTLYMVTGIASMILGPLIGKVSDAWGKYRIFVAGTVLTIFIVIIYCNLGSTPIWVVMGLNIIMFAGISARMISSQALVSAVPEQADRGAFMSLNSATQQISGGIASYIAGMIVVQAASGELLHYDTLGYVVAASMVITVVLIGFVNQYIASKLHKTNI